MAFSTPIFNIYKKSVDANNVTTDAVDSTGCNSIEICACTYGGDGATLTDSKGNTYAARTSKQNTGATEKVQLYYTDSTVNGGPINVGSGHTFTLTAVTNGCYPAIGAAGFSGAHTNSYEDEAAGVNSVGGTTVQPGSKASIGNGRLFIVAATQDATTTNSFTIDSSFIELADSPYTTYSIGIHWAYKIQPSIGAENPTLTFVDAAIVGKACVMAIFAPAAGGGGSTPPVKQPTVTGILARLESDEVEEFERRSLGSFGNAAVSSLPDLNPRNRFIFFFDKRSVEEDTEESERRELARRGFVKKNPYYTYTLPVAKRKYPYVNIAQATLRQMDEEAEELDRRNLGLFRGRTNLRAAIRVKTNPLVRILNVYSMVNRLDFEEQEEGDRRFMAKMLRHKDFYHTSNAPTPVPSRNNLFWWFRRHHR